MKFPEEHQLGAFGTVADFAVVINDEKHIVFSSAKAGELASFPAWDNADRDLRHFTPYDVPIGSYDAPYEDADDAWRITIFEHEGFVYVLEGTSPTTEDYPLYFRVPRERYLQAWAAVIDRYNPIEPLDDMNEG